MLHISNFLLGSPEMYFYFLSFYIKLPRRVVCVGYPESYKL
jgi:hypothetical protein